MLRTSSRSSATVPRCGSRSESSMPHWPCLLNLRLRAQQRGRVFLQKGEPHVLDQRLGQLLAVQFVELRLGIEQVDLARRAFHENEDAALARGAKCGGLGASGSTHGHAGRVADRGPSRPSPASAAASAAIAQAAGGRLVKKSRRVRTRSSRWRESSRLHGPLVIRASGIRRGST